MLARLLRVLAVIPVVFQLQNVHASSSLECGLRQEANACVAVNSNVSCGWCASAYSCTSASAITCANECAFCLNNASCTALETVYEPAIPPPSQFDYFCRNGGTKVYSSDFPFQSSSPNQRFGGHTCACPSTWNGTYRCMNTSLYCRRMRQDLFKSFAVDILCECCDGKLILRLGHDCSVCAGNSSCSTSVNSGGEICNLGWVPTLEVPLRSLRCVCTSTICQDVLSAGSDEATVSIDLSFQGSNDFDVTLSIDKRVPNPNDRFKETGSVTRQSTLLLGADVSGCSVKRRINCKNDQGSGPWSATDRCTVMTCGTASIVCPPSTPVPGGGQFDFHGSTCNSPELNAFLQAPFVFACVEESDGSIESVKSCSFVAGPLSHGSLTLTCSAGTCADFDDPEFPLFASPACGPFDIDEETCNSLKYSGIFLGPIVLCAAFVGVFFLADRRQVRALHASRMSISVAANTTEDFAIATPLKKQAPLAQNRYVYLAFNNIQFTVAEKPSLYARFVKKAQPRERKVLNGITGHFGGPDMVALLGPSGSGKTSLIDILAGRKSASSGIVSGEIAIGGEYASRRLLQQNVGYVLQEDVLPGTQTVMEFLLFHANLRMVNSPLSDRINRVLEVVQEMSLESCADTVIGDAYRKGISGGEKRRASIACELLADRRIILLDEPTSGLDSASSQQVLNSLRRVVNSGVGVAASIHQPSTRLFKQFDKVMLLSRNGYLAYSGPVSALEAFFTSAGFEIPSFFNPAEFALDLTMQNDPSIEKLVRAYYDSPIRAEEDEMTNKSALVVPEDDDGDEFIYESSLPPFRKQFYVLSARFAANAVRHPILPLVHVFATLLVALIAMLLYMGIRDDLGGAINRAGFFFFIQTYLTLSALADLGVWQEERLVFIRERTSGLYEGEAFLLSKFLCEILPLRLIPITLASSVLVFGIGLQSVPADKVGTMMVVLMYVSVISAMLFLFIGFVFRSNGIANFVAVVTALFCLLMSGFLLIDFGFVTNTSSGEFEVNWFPVILGFLSYLRPAFEILMVNELSGLIFEIVLVDPGGTGNFVPDTSLPASGDLLLAQINLQPDDVERDFWFLTGWLVLFTGLCILVLRLGVKERR